VFPPRKAAGRIEASVDPMHATPAEVARRQRRGRGATWGNLGQLGATWHLKPEGRQAHVSERGPKPAQLISDPCSLGAKPRPPSTRRARSCPFSSCISRAAWPCFVSRRRIAREKHATLFQRGAVGSGKRQIYPKHNTRPFAANQAQCCVVACCWLCSGFHTRNTGGGEPKINRGLWTRYPGLQARRPIPPARAIERRHHSAPHRSRPSPSSLSIPPPSSFLNGAPRLPTRHCLPPIPARSRASLELGVCLFRTASAADNNCAHPASRSIPPPHPASIPRRGPSHLLIESALHRPTIAVRTLPLSATHDPTLHLPSTTDRVALDPPPRHGHD